MTSNKRDARKRNASYEDSETEINKYKKKNGIKES